MPDQIKKILSIASETDKVELTILHNAAVNTANAYKGDSTSVRLKDWTTAKEALKDCLASLADKYNPDEQSLDQAPVIAVPYTPTKIKRDVYRYLAASGYDISETQFYDHCAAGLLRLGAGGKYHKKSIDKYAKSHLKRAVTGQTFDGESDELARDKQVKVNKKLDLEIARNQYNFDLEKGKYVLKASMHLELAARAAVLDAGLDNMIQTQAMEMIVLVHGEPARAVDLIEFLKEQKNDLLNDYASIQEFEIIFNKE